MVANDNLTRTSRILDGPQRVLGAQQRTLAGIGARERIGGSGLDKAFAAIAGAQRVPGSELSKTIAVIGARDRIGGPELSKTIAAIGARDRIGGPELSKTIAAIGRQRVPGAELNKTIAAIGREQFIGSEFDKTLRMLSGSRNVMAAALARSFLGATYGGIAVDSTVANGRGFGRILGANDAYLRKLGVARVGGGALGANAVLKELGIGRSYGAVMGRHDDYLKLRRTGPFHGSASIARVYENFQSELRVGDIGGVMKEIASFMEPAAVRAVEAYRDDPERVAAEVDRMQAQVLALMQIIADNAAQDSKSNHARGALIAVLVWLLGWYGVDNTIETLDAALKAIR